VQYLYNQKKYQPKDFHATRGWRTTYSKDQRKTLHGRRRFRIEQSPTLYMTKKTLGYWDLYQELRLYVQPLPRGLKILISCEVWPIEYLTWEEEAYLKENPTRMTTQKDSLGSLRNCMKLNLTWHITVTINFKLCSMTTVPRDPLMPNTMKQPNNSQIYSVTRRIPSSCCNVFLCTNWIGGAKDRWAYQSLQDSHCTIRSSGL
jgi:hypothetical protein